MKKFLLAFLLIPVLCFAGNIQQYHMMLINQEQGSGGACSTPDNGDELDEGFLGAGYESSMSDDQGSPDEDHTLSGSPPTGSCTEGIQFSCTDGADASAQWDMGSAHDISAGDLDIYFSLYVDSASMANYNNFVLLNWDNNTDEWNIGGVAVRFRYNDPNFQIYADGTVDSSYVTLSLDTWYEVKIHLDSTSADSYFQVTGGSSTTCDLTTDCTFTDFAVDSRYLRIGPSSISGTDDAVIEVGYIYVNSP